MQNIIIFNMDPAAREARRQAMDEDDRMRAKQPHELTQEEMRDLFIEKIHAYVESWESESRRPTSREKLNGLAFSILALIDGSDIDLPSFKLISDPHPKDKEYCQELGENWFPKNVDIAGCLHDNYHKKEV